MTFTKLASTTAALAALLAAPAFAQEMGDVDTNTDMMVDETEFGTSFSAGGAYGTWDSDASGTISEDEFNAGLDGAFDTDMSGDMSDDEQMAMDDSPWSGADFATWDSDASGDLSEEEFSAGVYSTYDADVSGDWDETEYGSYSDEGLFGSAADNELDADVAEDMGAEVDAETGADMATDNEMDTDVADEMGAEVDTETDAETETGN